MTLRRAAAALPLALSVAVVAHVVGFGADHVPGGGHAAVFLGSLLAALVACTGWAFAAALLSRSTLRSIATRRSDGYLCAGLVAGGAVAFLAMEFAEGHFGLGHGTVAALLALVPAALLVALCSRRIEASAVRAGFAAARVTLRVARVVFSYSNRQTRAAFFRPARMGVRAMPGRAPPLHA